MPPELVAPAGTFGLPDDGLQAAIHRKAMHGRRSHADREAGSGMRTVTRIADRGRVANVWYAASRFAWRRFNSMAGPLQRRVDRGAVFGEVPAGGDGSRHFLGAAI